MLLRRRALIHANLETAIVLAKVALESDDERAVIRTRQKACEAYEEALYCLRTAVLTQIEFEAIRTTIRTFGLGFDGVGRGPLTGDHAPEMPFVCGVLNLDLTERRLTYLHAFPKKRFR